METLTPAQFDQRYGAGASDKFNAAPAAQPQGPGPVQGAIQSIASPFLREGVTAGKAVAGIASLGALGVGKLTGNKTIQDVAKQGLQDSASTNPVDLGYFGKVQPYQNAKEAAGGGLEIGSYMVGAPEAQGVVDATRAGRVVKGAVAGLKGGATVGALQGAGSAMQQDKGIADVAKGAVLGGVGGAAVGGAVGGALPVLVHPGTAVSKAASAISGEAPTAESLAGKITNAKPQELSRAVRGLTTGLQDISKENTQSFEGLSNHLSSKIKSNLSQVDEAFGQNTKAYKPKSILQSVRISDAQPRNPDGTLSSNYIKNDFVQRAIDHLAETYQKTVQPENEAAILRLGAKYQSEGLTPQEINNLARQYGTDGPRAFGKNGEQLTSVNSAASENIRKGVKDAARNLMPDDTTRVLDKQTSDMIHAQKLVDNMHGAVQKLENKLNNAGVIQRLGSGVAKGVDLISGGFFKGFLKQLAGIGASDGTSLNALELQKQLPKMIAQFEKLNKLNPSDAVTALNAMIPRK